MAAIKLTVDRIQPGLHIRLPLKWNDHPFLLNSFKIKDQEQVEMIRHLGVKFVYFNPEQSDVSPLPANQPQAEVKKDDALDIEAQKLWQEKQKRIEKLSAYRRRVIQCEKEFERSLARMRSVMTKIRNRPADAVGEAKQLIDDIVDKLMCDDNVTLHLMNGKNEFEDIYFHSLNVAVIAMMIGRAKGYSAEQLKALSFAALFHDMGKIKIPTAILRKQTPLSEPESNYLKLHTKYGLDMANQIEDFPDSAKTVIAQHHELRDGSGYPEGLKGDEIDELAQVIIVANAFDNLCHTPIASEQKIPYTALSHLYKNCKHLYKEENLNILIKFMGVFPPGTVVQLSNNMVGLVISVNASHLLFPNVLVYDPAVPRTQAPIIDLASKDIKIVNAIHPSKLPEKIKEYLNPRSRISYFFDSDE
ncbi:HD-GYP domain-containing protein [Vibrio owensii]|uniref:HD-GYP domain-containing protein n=1 Tax=Vibrio owensii TaxID=696485 RepID=UPI003AAACEFA